MLLLLAACSLFNDPEHPLPVTITPEQSLVVASGILDAAAIQYHGEGKAALCVGATVLAETARFGASWLHGCTGADTDCDEGTFVVALADHLEVSASAVRGCE